MRYPPPERLAARASEPQATQLYAEALVDTPAAAPASKVDAELIRSVADRSTTSKATRSPASPASRADRLWRPPRPADLRRSRERAPTHPISDLLQVALQWLGTRGLLGLFLATFTTVLRAMLGFDETRRQLPLSSAAALFVIGFVAPLVRQAADGAVLRDLRSTTSALARAYAPRSGALPLEAQSGRTSAP